MKRFAKYGRKTILSEQSGGIPISDLPQENDATIVAVSIFLWIIPMPLTRRSDVSELFQSKALSWHQWMVKEQRRQSIDLTFLDCSVISTTDNSVLPSLRRNKGMLLGTNSVVRNI